MSALRTSIRVHLVGHWAPRVAARLRSQRRALYPSLSAAELYDEQRAIRAAWETCAPGPGAAQARRREWLGELLADVRLALDVREEMQTAALAAGGM